ncbi:MAG: GspE/PulE family protein [Candidatus Nomurabacteria bacterium]|jgi:type II secretory ATPase GspE/PulE/Tfp pilus assembly ATPase PilB-like protein|nr:GspE/PulE family protein [Candidatus Nomurabacteria bacterium]
MNEEERQRRFREADEKNTARRAAILGVPYLDMRDYENKVDLLPDMMTVEDMYRYRMVPLAFNEEVNLSTYGITLSTPETRLQEMRKAAAQSAGNNRYQLISDSAFRALMKRYDPPKEISYEDINISGDDETVDRQTTIASMSDALNQVRSEDILSYLIFQADQLSASDIHLENQRESVRVRFRIDGTLHEIANISHDKYRELFFAIASAANLSTAAQKAQSGHIVRNLTIADARKFGKNRNLEEEKYTEHILNMRIETVPTSYGQDAVIRLFNFTSTMLKIDALGLSDDERDELNKIISHPNGMVMVVGPTGSGKSTTLYSMINELNNPTRKILTLEDPIEFDIPGVVQVPIDTTHGQSFADNVRTILRLDPDVVMIGEIRDNDTAHAAIQAAITGHLLLATFHANDAAAAFSRMIDMIGVNPIFATSIRLVIGQRLVRRLDDATKIEYEPSESEKTYIRQILSDLPEHITKPDLDNFKLWKAGSSDSNPFGYHGRIVLMEQLIVNDEIAGFLRGDIKDISAKAIAHEAHNQGMVTMLQKGILKVLAGETTLEEINRVL